MKNFFQIFQNIAIATAIVVGFFLAHFLRQIEITIDTFIIAIIFYLSLIAFALLFSFFSNKFSTQEENGDKNV
ncbi:MAG: hypothetical protein ACE5NG_11665 [bacterium]